MSRALSRTKWCSSIGALVLVRGGGLVEVVGGREKKIRLFDESDEDNNELFSWRR